MTRYALALALTLTVLLSAGPAAACGITATCGDVNASLSGEIILDGFRVTWDSSNADTGVGYYRLAVYPTGNPDAARWLTYVNSYTDCSQHGYGFTDSPASGDWTYRLDTYPPVGTTACYVTIDTVIP